MKISTVISITTLRRRKTVRTEEIPAGRMLVVLHENASTASHGYYAIDVNYRLTHRNYAPRTAFRPRVDPRDHVVNPYHSIWLEKMYHILYDTNCTSSCMRSHRHNIFTHARKNTLDPTTAAAPLALHADAEEPSEPLGLRSMV